MVSKQYLVVLFLPLAGILLLVVDNLAQQAGHKGLRNVDKKAEIYRLIFVNEYQGKRLSVGDREFDQHRLSRLQNLAKQLNEAGSRNYRLLTAIGTSAAIVRLDESQFEYDWFETTGPVHFVKTGLGAKLDELNKVGFRLVEQSPISRSCEFLDPNEPAFGEKCVYKDLFLVEKELSSNRKVEQILSRGSPGWGGKPSEEITLEIGGNLAEGFYPVMAISRFEILLERAQNKEDVLDDKPDVKIVRSGWGTNNVPSKINEFAKNGYRLAMTNNGIAVLYRNKETAKSVVSYIWLRTDRKGFEKELQKLQEKGVRYTTYYPDERGTRNTLIFEQQLDGKDAQSEFRILSFQFDVKEDQAEGKVYIELTQSSKETVKTMNELANEGFIVRDLFDSGNVSVIMERTRRHSGTGF